MIEKRNEFIQSQFLFDFENIKPQKDYTENKNYFKVTAHETTIMIIRTFILIPL